VLTAPAPTYAEDTSELTVQMMLSWCKEEQTKPGSIYCLALLKGVSEVMAINGDGVRTGAITGGPPPSMCVPKGENLPSGGAMIQAFINWGEANPTYWGERGSIGMIYALQETWPC
jgi:hypothetical protein